MTHQRNEPQLLDLLRDPVAQTLMARDGVSRDAIMGLVVWAAMQRTIEGSAPPEESGVQ